jgi:hypothetical protein
MTPMGHQIISQVESDKTIDGQWTLVVNRKKLNLG